MIDLTKFKAKNPNKRELGTFTDAELDAQRGKLPDEIIWFLRQEGKCTYNDDCLWTALPYGWHDVFTDWGLKGKDCHVFMRSSFGSLLFWRKKEFFVLNTISGTINGMDSEVDYLFNDLLSSDLALRVEFWRDEHLAHRKDLPDLKEDEMYAFNPIVPKKGITENSKIEVVNMKAHIARLAELYKHKTSDHLRF